MYKREAHEELRSLEKQHRRARALHAHAWMGLAGSGAQGWTHPYRLGNPHQHARVHGAHTWVTKAIGAHARMARTGGKLHVTSLKEIMPGDF